MTEFNYVELAKTHRDAEILVAKTYGFTGGHWNGKGCSVGCFAKDAGATSDVNIHAFVADAFDIPEWAVRLQDRMFEGLPQDKRGDWHVDFAVAVSGVSNWQNVLHAIHCAILDVALKTAGSVAPQVQAVRDLHAKREPKESAAWSAAWKAASNAAWSAASSAAWSAASSAAWSAAENAAWSAAENAADSAASSAAENAAWSAAENAGDSAADSAAENAGDSAADSAAENAAWSAAENAGDSAADSAASSAAWSAASSAAFVSMSQSILAAIQCCQCEIS